MFDAAGPEAIRAAQLISGAAMAALLLSGLAGRYAARLRWGIFCAYVAAAAVVVAYAVAR